VDWKRTVNAKLVRATGYELRRSPRRHSVAEVRSGDRLVAAPVFILCTLRSGSTLLRVLLNSHSQIHAPHELHLRYVSVTLDKTWSKRSMKQMGLDAGTLEYLLWDRLLHRELSGSGKRMIVEKTPSAGPTPALSSCCAIRPRSPARGRSCSGPSSTTTRTWT